MDDRPGDARRVTSCPGSRPPRPPPAVPLPASSSACRSRSRATSRPRGSGRRSFAMYGQLPSYRAMIDREGLKEPGAAGPADLAIIGDEEAVAAAIRRVEDAGATEFFGIGLRFARGPRTNAHADAGARPQLWHAGAAGATRAARDRAPSPGGEPGTCAPSSGRRARRTSASISSQDEASAPSARRMSSGKFARSRRSSRGGSGSRSPAKSHITVRSFGSS